MYDFQLHPRLDQDCFKVTTLPLCQLLMMNDQQYPWFILVPQRPNIREIHQLSAEDRYQLLSESCLLSEALQTLYQPDKLNIAAIGNLVPQLHIHHVARFQHDAVWPAPIWGKLPPQPFALEEAQLRINILKNALKFCPKTNSLPQTDIP